MSMLRLGVNALFIKDDKILLLRRSSKVWSPGSYCFPAGHVELGEPVQQALVREIKEELGVVVRQQDLQFIHVAHSWHERTDGKCPEYVSFFFLVSTWEGEICNQEPDKHDEMAWFALDQLPQSLLYRHVVDLWRQNEQYSELGWK